MRVADVGSARRIVDDVDDAPKIFPSIIERSEGEPKCQSGVCDDVKSFVPRLIGSKNWETR